MVYSILRWSQRSGQDLIAQVFGSRLVYEVSGTAVRWGRKKWRKGIPQSTSPTPIRAGKGSCTRMRNATTTDSKIKVIGATGNHQARTGCLSRNSVEAASA